MLSILIPVYNFDINALVNTLHRQCQLAGIDFEILCLDDGSDIKFQNKNQKIQQLSQVVYQVLPKNVGRSAIRNQLGKMAQYEYLIFMDCDSQVNHSDYITRYLRHLHPQKLLYGGRSYSPQPPTQIDYYFHWFYGIHREQSSATVRAQSPWHAFMTNNFLIPKSIFLSILFDENLRQYGHEDTLFGMELKKRNIPIIHLDNPLEHIGLENTAVFLSKTQKAIENLLYLSKKNPLIETRLLQTFHQCQKWQLSIILKPLLKSLNPFFIKNFHSKSPRLLWFDLYKLGLILNHQKH